MKNERITPVTLNGTSLLKLKKNQFGSRSVSERYYALFMCVITHTHIARHECTQLVRRLCLSRFRKYDSLIPAQGEIVLVFHAWRNRFIGCSIVARSGIQYRRQPQGPFNATLSEQAPVSATCDLRHGRRYQSSFSLQKCS